MNDHKNEPLYLIDEKTAYRIEGLISLLAMAVWEILREGEMQCTPPQDDVNIAQLTFETEIRSVLKNENNAPF